MIAEVNLMSGSAPAQAGSATEVFGEDAGQFAAFLEQAEAAGGPLPVLPGYPADSMAVDRIVVTEWPGPLPEWSGAGARPPFCGDAIPDEDLQIHPEAGDETEPAADGVLHPNWLQQQPLPLPLYIPREPAAPGLLPAGDDAAVGPVPAAAVMTSLAQASVDAPSIADERIAERASADVDSVGSQAARPAETPARILAPAPDMTAPGRTMTDAPAAGSVATDRPAIDRPVPGAAATDRPAIDRPAPGTAATDRPAIDRPAPGTAATDRPAIDRPSPGTAATDRPAIDRPAPGTVAIDRPAIDRPALGTAATDRPTIDRPAIDRPSFDSGAIERPPLERAQTFRPENLRAVAAPAPGAPLAESPASGPAALPAGPEFVAQADPVAPPASQRWRLTAAASRLSAAIERVGGASVEAVPEANGAVTTDSRPSNGDASGLFAASQNESGRIAALPARAGAGGPVFAVQSTPALQQVAPAASAPAVTLAPTADVPTADTVQQLVQTMRVQFRDGIGEAVVRLKPEHLGEVSITLRVDRQGVSATVNAEVANVRHWLESQEGSLRQGLADHGLHLQKFVVREDGRGREPDARQEQPPKRQGGRPAANQDDSEPRFEVTV